jgi:hypothetical protein
MSSTTKTTKVPAPTNVSVGPTTILGVLATILAAGGSVYAAIQANDTATIAGGVFAILTALSTLGGRFAQALVIAKAAAARIGPVLDEFADIPPIAGELPDPVDPDA